MKSFLKYEYLLVLLGLFYLPSNILWAQNSELANHNWYFNHGEVNGEAFFLPDINLPSHIVLSEVFYSYDLNCHHGWSFYEIEYEANNNIFSVLDNPTFLVGWDYCPDYQRDFMALHSEVYFTYSSTDNPTYITKNPFTYILTSVDDYFQLKIENSEGDWAVYNSVVLSEPSFETKKFNLYPNPVTNILNIQGSNDVLQNARLELFDVTGKSLSFETIATDANFVSINVSHLNTGIYFLKINHKNASQETLKFVKP
jgi:hypothetical protein